jgi:CRISPR/Cas system CSM-associated protein Csm3 (group 7 of RAMP superfamily)
MFGAWIEGRGDEPTGSRVLTRESELKDTRDLVQSRVKIDRFTGGSYPGALFTQQPAYGGNGATVGVCLELRQPRDAEIGLLLLVLKDLWTGDLPLGGESSVGRGRLKGESATLTLRREGREVDWTLTQAGEGLEITGPGTRSELEGFVTALHQYGREP